MLVEAALCEEICINPLLFTVETQCFKMTHFYNSPLLKFVSISLRSIYCELSVQFAKSLLSKADYLSNFEKAL